MSNINQAIAGARASWDALPDNAGLDFMREAKFAVQILSGNSAFEKCTPASIQRAFSQVRALGLSLNPATKHAYLIPRGGQCTLDVSYMGMLKLLTDAGAIRFGVAEVIRENDEFDYNPAGYPRLTHRVTTFSEAKRGAPVAAYCALHLPDGSIYHEVMAWEEIMRIKARSASSKGTSPWTTDELEMAKKTVVRRAFKYAPKSFVSTAQEDRVSEAIKIIDENTEVVNAPAKSTAQSVEAALAEEVEYETVAQNETTA